MSERVTKFMRIDDRRKFSSFKKAETEANRIREKVKREAEKNNYAVQMLIGISDMDGKTKEAREPHLHIMFYACPCDTILTTVVAYINDYARKNCFEYGSCQKRKNGFICRDCSMRVATKHNCNKGYKDYIEEQSRKRRYFERDPDNILNNSNITRSSKNLEPNSFRTVPPKKAKKVRKVSRKPVITKPTCNCSPHEGSLNLHPLVKGGTRGTMRRSVRIERDSNTDSNTLFKIYHKKQKRIEHKENIITPIPLQEEYARTEDGADSKQKPAFARTFHNPLHRFQQ